MTSNIRLDKAYLTAIWLETLFYGVNATLFCGYLFMLRYKHSRTLARPIVIVGIAMFLLSTVHVSLGFYRLIEGFIYLRNEPGGPAAFFSDVSLPPNVAKVIFHTVNCILGDSIVVWRCYHVWGGDWKICVLPIALILASAACGFGQGIVFAQAKTTHSAFNPVLERWNGSLFSLSLATNVVCTVLVAGRIWYLTKDLAPAVDVVSFRSRRILALVVESAMVYSAALVIEITLYFVGSNAFYIVYDPIGQLTAIVPTSIIVITSLGMTANDLQSNRTLTSARFAPAMIGRTYDVTGSACDVGDNIYDLDPDTSRSDFPPTTDMSLRSLDKLRSRLSTI